MSGFGKLALLAMFLVSVASGCQVGSSATTGPALSIVQPVAFRIDSNLQYTTAHKLSHAFTIVSIGYDSIILRGVTFNGETAARLADLNGNEYRPSARALPVTLRPQESIVVFQDNSAGSAYM